MEAFQKEYDVIVVGSGPGGATVARELSKQERPYSGVGEQFTHKGNPSSIGKNDRHSGKEHLHYQ
jgi:thioredoxin reductase